MTDEVTIAYEDVYKRFDTPVLSGVSLSVMRGETISILGTSGTGKSVLLKTTIGLITPDRGDVKIDGESVYHSSRTGIRDLRRTVRYVFQYAALFDSLNIYDNVAMGLDPETISGLDKKTMLDRIARSLENVNLDPGKVLAKLPAELSGGMRKRVGLARAIVGEPRIILYDEPVTGLDPVNAATVNRLIMSIAERTKVTSIVVTHDVPGALEMSHRVALLDNGKLRFVGSPEEFGKSDDPLVMAFADRQAAARAALKLIEHEIGDEEETGPAHAVSIGV
ncbi:MAG TPA: ATP-binding cassette domain-containing protein [Vicinamibacteria bacterium]|nr:ATP-binding cassette domain-containing protein [Vicinamibacteria bacterium]